MIRLLRGDCLDVLAGMAAESVDAVLTDPPYGIAYQSSWNKAAQRPRIANDGQPFIWWIHPAALVLRDGGALVCFCRWDVQETFRVAIEAAGLTIRSQLVWDRAVHGMGDLKAQFAPQHDVAWFATKGRFAFPGKRPRSVMRYPRPTGDKIIHPTEKPVPLMAELVRSVTRPGAVVLDPFMGAGSTGIACAEEGRSFVGIEIDPGYFRIAKRRIAEAERAELQVAA